MSTSAMKPPVATSGPVAWAKENLFGSTGNTIISLVMIGLLVMIVPPLIDWAFVSAVWVADNALCRQA
ncbi:MAG: amino acid ABC transporter permease, partial [Hyphomicrobiaceae bacterium]